MVYFQYLGHKLACLLTLHSLINKNKLSLPVFAAFTPLICKDKPFIAPTRASLHATLPWGCLCSKTGLWWCPGNKHHQCHESLTPGVRSQGKDRVLSFSHQLQNQPSIMLRHIQQGYRSQVSGRGQPEMILVMLRQSKHRRSFSHFSTGSPGAYLMDSCRDTSCNVRATRVGKGTQCCKPQPDKHPTGPLCSQIRKLSAADFSSLKSLLPEASRVPSFPHTSPFPQLQSTGTCGAAADSSPSHRDTQPRGAVPEVSLAVAVDLFSAVRVTWLWALCWRSCWMSFRDSDRPVPSYLETRAQRAWSKEPGSHPELWGSRSKQWVLQPYPLIVEAMNTR